MMKRSVNIFYSAIFLIFFQSCLIVNNFYKTPSKNTNEENKKNDKILRGSGKFVELNNRKQEVYFSDDITPKGFLVIADSLAKDSLKRIIIVNDTIIKNNF